MIFASGFVEANEEQLTNSVAAELKARQIEVNGINGDRIVFLIERETAQAVKAELEGLGSISGVRSVHLTYFSLEGSDEDIIAQGISKA